MGSLLFFVVSRSCLSIIDNMEWRVETLLKVATRVGIVSLVIVTLRLMKVLALPNLDSLSKPAVRPIRNSY